MNAKSKCNLRTFRIKREQIDYIINALEKVKLGVSQDVKLDASDDETGEHWYIARHVELEGVNND